MPCDTLGRMHGLLEQLLRDVLEHLGIDVRTKGGGELWLGREVGRREPFGWTILHLEGVAILRVLARPDLGDLLVVLGAESIEDAVQPLGLVLSRFGEALVADVGNRQELADVDAGQLLQRSRVGDDVDAAADEEVPDHLARDVSSSHIS